MEEGREVGGGGQEGEGKGKGGERARETCPSMPFSFPGVLRLARLLSADSRVLSEGGEGRREGRRERGKE